jgi:hypothetical protein
MGKVAQKFWRRSLLLAAGTGSVIAVAASAKEFGDWSAPVSAEALSGSSNQINMASNDGCPILSPYTNDLYMASNRSGGQGGLEIVWDSTRAGARATDNSTATRSSVDEPWGTAVQLPDGINSAQGESRASMSWDGTTMMFGSTRPGEGSSDIYVTFRDKATGKR